MPDYSKRTGYAPWSLTREAGVQSATVNGTIDVPQTCQPTINTGVIDEKGNWQGIKADDEVFIGLTKEEGIADGGTVLFPNTNAFPSIDMTGFSSVAIAIKTTRNGNYAFDLIMGPDTTPFANLSPVNAGSRLRMLNGSPSTTPTFTNILEDGAENLGTDVWDVFFLYDRAAGQKNMQFRITNNSGGNANIEFGFMRLV